MDEKYYTPDKEDLFIGYECEQYTPANTGIDYLGHYYESWDKRKLKNGWELLDISERSKIVRTKYLNKEDIESLGWQWYTNCSSGEEYELFINDNKYSLIQVDYSHDIYIYKHNTYGETILFSGRCKSINELKKIMLWLNIKNN